MRTTTANLLCALLLLLTAALWYPVPLRSAATRVSPQAASVAAPGQLLVKYAPPAHSGPATQAQDQAALLDLANAASAGQARLLGHIPQLGVWLLQVPATAEMSAASELRGQPGVLYVEPNYRASALEVPNDEKWSEQWALLKINAPQAWDITHSQGVLIAMLDSGAYWQHPDLVNVVWTNAGETPANGRDDDGNGKVDDIHGWRFYHNCTTGMCLPAEDSLIADDNGHGTHATGIAVAETNNAIGVAGVSWGAQAMIVKVLDAYGDGYYYDIATGMVYAVDNGARILNLSLGGDNSSLLLQDAADYAHARGALVVAAAGNSGGAVLYPAACDHVMAVAATNWNDERASFSNQGPQVDIAAPGESIIGTWLPSYLYYYKRGTSMAAPHVSGAAALLWTWRPDWSNEQIQERLQAQADDVNSDLYPGHDDYLGWGRLNLYRILADLPPGPTPTPTLTPTPTATLPAPIYRVYVPLGWSLPPGQPPFPWWPASVD